MAQSIDAKDLFENIKLRDMGNGEYLATYKDLKLRLFTPETIIPFSPAE